MGYFPLCVDLENAIVLVVGRGPQTEDKIKKLRPFCPKIRSLEYLTPEDLMPRPALVVAGDLPREEKLRTSGLCRERGIPVNVVDTPELCTFFFPALITRGDLTVSVSTGGKSPAAAAQLRRRLEEQIPDRTGDILDWLQDLRPTLDSTRLKQAARQALSLGRPLTQEELDQL